MAVRTNSTNIKAILLNQYDLENTPDLTAFIAAASNLTDKLDTCDSDDENDSADLEMIERYLAAHFYLLADQAISREKTLDAEVDYQGKTDSGLKSTFFGQMAMTLDTSGCLAKFDTVAQRGGRKTVSFDWLGKAPSNQIDYADRD